VDDVSVADAQSCVGPAEGEADLRTLAHSLDELRAIDQAAKAPASGTLTGNRPELS
jgi:hypothetical protein